MELVEDLADPAVAIGRHGPHRRLQIVALEPAGAVDLANRLAIALGENLDMRLDHGPETISLLAPGASAEKDSDPHAEAVRQKVGDSENDDYAGAEVGANRARNDSEGSDRSVYRAEHEVAQVRVPWPLR